MYIPSKILEYFKYYWVDNNLIKTLLKYTSEIACSFLHCSHYVQVGWIGSWFMVANTGEHHIALYDNSFFLAKFLFVLQITEMLEFLFLFLFPWHFRKKFSSIVSIIKWHIADNRSICTLGHQTSYNRNWLKNADWEIGNWVVSKIKILLSHLLQDVFGKSLRDYM